MKHGVARYLTRDNHGTLEELERLPRKHAAGSSLPGDEITDEEKPREPDGPAAMSKGPGAAAVRAAQYISLGIQR